MRLRSVFLAGCVSLALPGLVVFGLSAGRAWVAWEQAQAAARGAQAVAKVMHASTQLMVTRGVLLDAMRAEAPDLPSLTPAIAATDAALAQAGTALVVAGFPSGRVEQASEGLLLARRRALDAIKRHVMSRSPVEAINRLIEGLDEESLRAERRITLASPQVGLVVGLARTAHELRATGGQRSAILSSWLGSQSIPSSDREQLLVLTGRLAGAWNRLQQGVGAAGATRSVGNALAFTEVRFFEQEEPWFRELVKAAADGIDPPMGFEQFRHWSAAALDNLLPVRDALMTEAVAQGRVAVATARRDLLVAAGAVSLLLGLVAVVMGALLRDPMMAQGQPDQ